MARLTGAQVDSLEGCDLFGAALPDQLTPEPQFAVGSASTTLCFSPVDGLTGHVNRTIRLGTSPRAPPCACSRDMEMES